MSKRDYFFLITAVVIVYIVSFGAVAYLDSKEEKEMRTVTTDIELTDAAYDMLEYSLAEHQKEGRLKNWNVHTLVGALSQKAVEEHVRKSLEHDEELLLINKLKTDGSLRSDNDNSKHIENLSAVTPDTAHASVSPSPQPEDVPDLLLRCIQAEAGNQCYEGKHAVADVIINRMNLDVWPDTLEGVIFQEGQFSVVTNGSINNVTPDEETVAAAISALNGNNVIPHDYVYFNTSPIGVDCIRIQDHWFGR